MRRFAAVLLAAALAPAGIAQAQPLDGDDGADPSWYDGADPYSYDESGEAAPEAYPAEAVAQQEWVYDGPHAVNAEYGSGWCYIQGRHSHPYPPFDDQLFQEQEDGGYVFLGDPFDFGYAGANFYWYVDVHPIGAGWGVGWCFIHGPHRHLYRPWGVHFVSLARPS